jgi:tRNA A37 threonylcarbamoyladenosine modification protein TsaB
MSSLALLAAGAEPDGEVAAAILGGHGELFVQQFDSSGEPAGALANLPPAAAAAATTAELVVGSGAQQLVDVRGWGEAREAWPSAANALKLPQNLRSLPAKPVYARAPDARVQEAA